MWSPERQERADDETTIQRGMPNREAGRQGRISPNPPGVARLLKRNRDTLVLGLVRLTETSNPGIANYDVSSFVANTSGLCFTNSDLNNDGQVNAFDLATLLGGWGPCPDPDDCPADIQGTGEGIVGAGDLAVLLGNWGLCE